MEFLFFVSSTLQIGETDGLRNLEAKSESTTFWLLYKAAMGLTGENRRNGKQEKLRNHHFSLSATLVLSEFFSF